MAEKTKISNPAGPAMSGFGGYAPSPDANGSRTIVPGMKHRGDVAPAGATEKDMRAASVKYQDRRIVGMLFSRSADSRGEVFPVYQGRNTIGSDPHCDIYLAEATVTPGHAVILARCMADSVKGDVMTVSITDYDTEYGTLVNGCKVGYDKVMLEGGENIGIGNGYTFLYLALHGKDDASAPSPGFLPLPREDNEPTEQSYGILFSETARKPEERIYPTAVGEAEENVFYGRTKKKQEDHSGAMTIDIEHV